MTALKENAIKSNERQFTASLFFSSFSISTNTAQPAGRGKMEGHRDGIEDERT